MSPQQWQHAEHTTCSLSPLLAPACTPHLHYSHYDGQPSLVALLPHHHAPSDTNPALPLPLPLPRHHTCITPMMMGSRRPPPSSRRSARILWTNLVNSAPQCGAQAGQWAHHSADVASTSPCQWWHSRGRHVLFYPITSGPGE